MDIPQLISNILKRETRAGSTYLTSLMYLLQKAIIDNIKSVDAIPPAIKLEEKERQIVPIEVKTPFMELSNNIE